MPAALRLAAAAGLLALAGCGRSPHVCTADAVVGRLSVDVTAGLVDLVLPDVSLCVDGDCREPAADVDGPPTTSVHVYVETRTIPAGEHAVRVELRQGGRVVLSASGTVTVRSSPVGSRGCEQQVRSASLRYDRTTGTLVPG